MLADGVQKFRRRHVHAKIHYAEVRALPHHRDEIFADVVHIALDRADDGAKFRLHTGGHEQRLQNFQRLFHRPRGDEHFGNKDFIPLETFAHDHHARHEAMLDDERRRFTRREALLHQLRHNLAVAGDDGLRERMVGVHADNSRNCRRQRLVIFCAFFAIPAVLLAICAPA
jgi:hypothetical protein